MRSRSTVLSHVLGTHPAICGYSELHHKYTSHMDLLKTRADLYRDLNPTPDNVYFLDKVLHNNLVISNKILQSKNSHLIYLLREPVSTIKSILNMGQLTGIDWYKDPYQAAQYYKARLANIMHMAEISTNGFFFIDADQLISETDKILSRLTDWLSLSPPLSKHYESFSNTGKPGYGDPSSNISSGTIKQTLGHADISLPDEIVNETMIAYQECRSFLQQSANL